MLEQLDQAEETKKELDQLNITSDDQEKFLRDQKNKRKHQTLPVAFTSSSPPVSADGRVSKTRHDVKLASSVMSDDVEMEDVDVKTPRESFELVFRFGSNWGNEEFIGLTEVGVPFSTIISRTNVFLCDVEITQY